MTTKDLLKIILQICASGGIAGLDALAIFLMFKQAKFYLTKVPSMNDYLVYTTTQRKTEEIEKDKQRWRQMSHRIYTWIPWIVLASLLLVALAVTVSIRFGTTQVELPQR